MKLFLSIILFSALLGNAIAQTTHVTVDSKMQFGSFTYYYLEGNNQLYKTSAFPDDVFMIGQSIELTDNADNNNYNITNPVTSHLGTARILNSSTNTDDINWSELDMPTTWNSMLHFRDTLHAVSFYEEFDAVFSEEDAGEYDEIAMDFLAQYPGYMSFWKYLIDKYGPVYFTDEDLIEMREESSSLPDPVQQLLVNDSRLVRIGGQVVYHNSISQIVACEASNAAAIERLKDVSIITDFDIYDPVNLIVYNTDYTIPFHDDFYPNDKLPTPDGKGDDKNYVYVGDDDMDQIRLWSLVNPIPNPVNCEPGIKKLSISVKRQIREYYDSNNDSIIDENDDYNWVDDFPNLFYEFENATLTIDWDDGSTPEIFSNYNHNTAGKSHTYANTGTYYPLTTLTFYSNTYNQLFTFEDGTNSTAPDAQHFEFINSGISCSTIPKVEYDTDVAGDYRLNSHIWVTHNYWGKHFGTLTQCFKKGASDPWSLKKADIITASVYGVFRNSSCINIKEESGHKARTNKKEARKSKTKNCFGCNFYRYAIANEDVTSNNYFIENTNVRNVDMILNVCE
jgi:hypothetical protein